MQFKHKVHITAYPTVELGGIVWAYMGPAEQDAAARRNSPGPRCRKSAATSPR